MNKIHRIVWRAIRNAFIVAHEKANTHGKPSSTRKTLVSGLMAAPPVNQLPTGGRMAKE